MQGLPSAACISSVCISFQPCCPDLQGSALLDGYAGCAASPNKNVRQGLATLLVNLAVLLGKVAAEELEFKARVGIHFRLENL